MSAEKNVRREFLSVVVFRYLVVVVVVVRFLSSLVLLLLVVRRFTAALIHRLLIVLLVVLLPPQFLLLVFVKEEGGLGKPTELKFVVACFRVFSCLLKGLKGEEIFCLGFKCIVLLFPYSSKECALRKKCLKCFFLTHKCLLLTRDLSTLLLFLWGRRNVTHY